MIDLPEQSFGVSLEDDGNGNLSVVFNTKEVPHDLMVFMKELLVNTLNSYNHDESLVVCSTRMMRDNISVKMELEPILWLHSGNHASRSYQQKHLQ